SSSCPSSWVHGLYSFSWYGSVGAGQLVLVLVRSVQRQNACGEAAWIDRFLVRFAAQPGVMRKRYA
ncbi:hypothetical protein VDP30_05175, partial [Xanthomonas campestris pv. campestris]|nr:hypothetical protein [Xanthomonas campestris pv. campestris]